MPNSLNLESGVQQGCTISPMLFLSTRTQKTTLDKPRSIQWTLFTQLEGLDYADDLAVLHQSQPPAREFWRAKKVILHVSTFKTHMVRRTTPRAPITVDASPADYDERFTYLGQLLRKDNLCSRDVRIQHIHKCSKHPGIQAAPPRLYKSKAKSVLLQGSECWCVWEGKMEMESRSFHGMFWPDFQRGPVPKDK